MTIKVYGFAMSSPTAMVLAALHEKAVTDFELVPVNLMTGAHKEPDYLAIHPFGQIPAMVDGPVTLIESRAIARFIAKKFEGQGTALYGSTLEESGLVEQWVEVGTHKFTPPAIGIMRERFAKPQFRGEQSDEAVVLANIQKLGKVLDVYEARLTNNKYLAGDFYSLADLSHIPFLNALVSFVNVGEVIEVRPHVKSWWEDISSRPAWKEIAALIQNETAQLKAYKKGQVKEEAQS